MARVEYKATAGGVLQRRNGDAWQGVTVQHTGPTVYAAETGTAPYPGPLTTNVDGEVPGWLDPGRYTTTNPISGKSVTFEVGGAASFTPSAAGVAFTPAGTVQATNVQAAIEEVAAEAGTGGSTADASTSVKGVAKLSVAPVLPTNPIAVGTNDARMTDARPPTAHGHPQSDVANLPADLAARIPYTLFDAKGDILIASADNAAGRLPLGPAGHVLTSDPAQTLGAKWAAPQGGIAATLVDAKGDLLVGLADDTVGRLAGGTDGHVLTRDAAATHGMRWAAPSGPGTIESKLVEPSGGGGSSTTLLADNFDDNIVDTAKWPASYGTYAEVGGRARVTATASYSGYVSASTYSLADASTRVRVPVLPAIGAGTTIAQLSVTRAGIGTHAIYWNNGFLYFQEKITGGATTTTNVAYSATNHLWWRIREAAGTVFWETSPDGTTWTTQRSKARFHDMTSVALSLDAGFYGTETSPGFAEFDDFTTVTTAGGTSSYTIGPADMGLVLELNAASAFNLVVPADASAAIPVNSWAELFVLGAGIPTVTAQSPATVQQWENKMRSSQRGTFYLRKRAANAWVLNGDLMT